MSRPEPVSARAFAERLNVSQDQVVRWCDSGRIFGARRHPLTKKWWIYPPAKLLPRMDRW